MIILMRQGRDLDIVFCLHIFFPITEVLASLLILLCLVWELYKPIMGLVLTIIIITIVIRLMRRARGLDETVCNLLGGLKTSVAGNARVCGSGEAAAVWSSRHCEPAAYILGPTVANTRLSLICGFPC